MFKYIESHTYAWYILTEIKLQGFVDINVTGFEKTNKIVIVDLFHLLAQLIATLTHYPFTVLCITRLDRLVYISRASFANYVNSQLR